MSVLRESDPTMFDRPGATVARPEVSASAIHILHHLLAMAPSGLYFHIPRGQAGLMRSQQSGCSWATARASVSLVTGTARRTTRSVSCPRSARYQHFFQKYANVSAQRRYNTKERERERDAQSLCLGLTQSRLGIVVNRVILLNEPNANE
jgi:hypothetical protein